MRFRKTKASQTKLLVSVNMQLIEQSGCSALRSRSGIVQLMSKIAGKFAERAELFCLLLHASDFAHTVKQHGNATLRHRGNSFQHLRKDFPRILQRPERRNGI